MDKAKVMPMFKGVLVLAVIALCSGLLLGLFNMITYVDPFQAALDDFEKNSGATGEFTMVVKEETESGKNGSIVYYAVSSDGVHAFLAEGRGGYQNGSLQVYIYVKNDVIFKAEYGPVDSSQTLIGDVQKGKILESFQDKNIRELNAFDTDIVSGATYTSNAVLNAVDAVVQYYNKNVAGGEANGQA